MTKCNRFLPTGLALAALLVGTSAGATMLGVDGSAQGAASLDSNQPAGAGLESGEPWLEPLGDSAVLALQVESAPVPEPTCLAAFAIGAIGLVHRRSRR